MSNARYSVNLNTTTDPDFSPTDPCDSPDWSTFKFVFQRDLTWDVAQDIVGAMNAAILERGYQGEWFPPR